MRHSSNSCLFVILAVAADAADRPGRISEGRAGAVRDRGLGLGGYCPTGTASITMPMFLAPALRQRSMTLMTSP